MPFNIHKCRLLYYRSGLNKKYDNKIRCQKIKSSLNNKDLWVIISQSFTFSQQNNEATKTTNIISGFINRNFTFKNTEIRCKKTCQSPFSVVYAVQS